MKKRTWISILVTLSVTIVILLAMGLSASAAEYDLWIAGNRVTDANKKDVLKDGVFNYDSANRILTISGDCKSGTSGLGGSEGDIIINSKIDDLTIDVLKDSNIATYNSTQDCAVALYGDTRITGEGKLSVTGQGYWLSGECHGIICHGSLILDDCTLNVWGTTKGIHAADGSGTLTVITSDVKCFGSGANGTKANVDGFVEETLTGCQIIPESLLEGDDKESLVIKRTTHIVNTAALNVRNAPGTGGNRIGGLVQDKEVVVLETQGEWSKIIYGTGFGWVQSKYLKKIKIITYTVTFDANGGSGTMPAMTVKKGRKLTLPACTFTPPKGKVFDRWIAGNPGDRVDVSSNSVIRAYWKDASPSDLPNPFTDVKDDDFFKDAVLWAVNHKPQITNGTSATTFSPNATCTRAHVVTFLWRAMGEPEPSVSTNPFSDVPSDAYYTKAVLWAVGKNISNGTSATTFGPEDPCTRAQVVTFLWRAADQPAPAGTNNPFKDVESGLYYYNAVLWAVNHTPQITKGMEADVFGTNESCTRGQIVTFLYRALA